MRKKHDGRPSLLVIDKEQFGHMTDPYKWCEHLRDKYDITFLTAALGKEHVEMDGIKVIYLPFSVPYVIRGIMFILASVWWIYRCPGVTIIEYFKHCSILRFLCPHKKLIVDVRTLSVESQSTYRACADARLISDCRKFENVTVISEGVKVKTGISDAKILPLGSDEISDKHKCYDDFRVLYVGTFNNRNLDLMIKGIAMFHTGHPEIPISVDIVGDGCHGQLDELKSLSEHLGLKNVVKFHGFVPLTKVAPFFDKCNIGLSFIPMTSYFDNQPPTKTFEYILSGLFCIATKTKENKILVTDSNGVLIDDTPEGVVNGLELYLSEKSRLSDTIIRESLKDSKWSNIVNRTLIPIIENAR